MADKVKRAWVVFDWANSAYSLVIGTAIFPQVFNHFAKEPNLFGVNFTSPTALYCLTVSFSYLLLLFVTPILSSLADHSGNKKIFMQFFTLLGSASCVLLYFFTEEYIGIGVFGLMAGVIGFSGSLVFYNAYLPEIAPVDEQDSLSALGFAYGYLGSSLLLILLLVCASFYETFGFDDEIMVFRIGFVIVGAWWFLFSLWTFKYMPVSIKKKSQKKRKDLIRESLVHLRKTARVAIGNSIMRKYLLGFFLVDLALQTLIIVAPLFAINVVELQGAELIILILLMQFLGIAGAKVFSLLSRKKGTIWAIVGATVIYTLICFFALSTENKLFFYVLGSGIGFALGGFQSQARSGYSKMITGERDPTVYFSFYDILEKAGIVIGTGVYGFICFGYQGDQDTALRIGIFVLGVSFMIGLIPFIKLRKEGIFKK